MLRRIYAQPMEQMMPEVFCRRRASAIQDEERFSEAPRLAAGYCGGSMKDGNGRGHPGTGSTLPSEYFKRHCVVSVTR
jgi:hypothetical protein